MRGSFNRRMTVRRGTRPAVGMSLAIRALDVPCRLVEQRLITQLQFPFEDSEWWVTMDEFRLDGPVSSVPTYGIVASDYLSADQVKFNHVPDVWWIVCREEIVEPLDGTAYWRYQLIPRTALDGPEWQPLDDSGEPDGELAPGAPTCDVATERLMFVLIQVEYVANGEPRSWWFRVSGLTPGAQYHLPITGFEGGLHLRVIDQDCNGDLVTESSNGVSCVPFVPPGDVVLIQVEGATMFSGTMRFKVEPGNCP